MEGFKMRYFISVLFVAMLSSQMNAQATRTWVSGVGDDANPCSRTAPCKTFAGAISKTAAGGEISALDPGGFGGFTITKSITINGDGNLTSVLVSGQSGITISSILQPTDVVILRSLSINGISGMGSGGIHGVNYLGGGMLVVENCVISGFTQNGINMSLTGSGNLVVRNSTITTATTGVRITSTSGMVQGSLSNVAIRGTTNGVWASYGNTAVSNSVLSQNTTYGALADGNATLTLLNDQFTGNGTAVQSLTGATVRISNNDVFDNGGGFRCDGGSIFSAGNNRKANNSGTGTVCTFSTPNIVVQ
jgi:hypothetical protein